VEKLYFADFLDFIWIWTSQLKTFWNTVGLGIRIL